MQTEPLDINQKAPSARVLTDFGTEIELADIFQKGPTLLYFYPRADTPGCTIQGCNLRDNKTELSNAGVTVVGVSADSVGAQAAFKKKYNLNFTLIADQKRELINAYGVTGRQSFLIKGGIIVWRQLKATPASQAQDLLAALKG